MTDEDGDIHEHFEYFPFGETWYQEGGNNKVTPYLFTSKELDSETGYYYFGARYYDPRVSTWISPDPILEKYLPTVRRGEVTRGVTGGVYEPTNLSLYSCSRNSPVTLKDPDGNAAPLLLVLIGGGGGSVGSTAVGVAITTTARAAVSRGLSALSAVAAAWGMRNESGAEDSPETVTQEDESGWIYGPKDDPKVNEDGSTEKGTWVTPDDFPSQGEAQDKLDPFKPAEGKRPVKIPAGTTVKKGKTPGRQGPFDGSDGANEVLIPNGLPPGSVGEWEPLDQ
ncbi:MAG: RHS repeat-associated core domain-containing protein [Gammaproteobacteria bacterium]|nr:RHS repeat-associated core domain-containing protein [Gammaproteobacteria bacterium]